MTLNKACEAAMLPATSVSARGSLTCIDLFAGAGGLAVGFRQAGWSVIAGNDISHEASSTFRLNFPEAVFFRQSATDISSKHLLSHCDLARGELDCLLGGPPCQSFSYNNHQRSAEDTRARLFTEYLRIVRDLFPKTIVMENVPGMLTIGDGSVVSTIISELRAIGYQTAIKILSAEEFGTPQVRKRVFIVGSLIGDPEALIPVASHMSASRKSTAQARLGLKRCVNVSAAIGDLPPISNGGGDLEVLRPSTPPFSYFQREARRGTRRIFNHVCHALTKVNLDRALHIPEGGNWRDIPRELLPLGMQRAKLSDHTKRYGRLSYTGLASTLLTKCDPHWGAYLHPKQHRTISVREAARLQGFPDTFVFAGRYLAHHYEQIGNAVPIPVARAIGVCVAKHLRSLDVNVSSTITVPNAHADNVFAN